MSPWYEAVLATLALWRVTHLLSAEDGPWQVVARLRRRLGTGFWGGLLDCFYCLSLWLAAPLAWWLAEDAAHGALLWLALSGAACLLQRATAEAQPDLPYFDEDPVGDPPLEEKPEVLS